VLFTSLIPQFVEPGPSATFQSLLLATVFVGLVWLVTYALLATAFADTLRRPTFRRALSAITGVVLIGLGLRLATESR
jgi:threonine/homoserine/homoserine lactone efflux protein